MDPNRDQNWDAPAAAIGRSAGGGVNVGSVERWASMLGGAALAARGLASGGPAGYTMAALGAVLAQRGATGHCQVYGALGVSTADEADRGGLAGLTGGSAEVLVESVATVRGSADELYRFWRDPTNLPRFMRTLEAVRPEGDRRAHWTLRPPVGPALEFATEVTHETEGEHIAWRSAETAIVEHTGEVRFEPMPQDRGTAVRLKLRFTPPGGSVGASLAGLFDGAMEMQLRSELKRFKQLFETGEIATTDGQPSARAER